MGIRRYLSLGLFVLLAGCQGVHPVMDTVTMAWPWRSQYAQLQPGVEYMVVTLDGRATVMALGQREVLQAPLGFEQHEHWYSSQHEMLHLMNGRIQKALGFTVEWRAQEANPPRWSEVQKTRHEVPWSRVLDIMPGYRYGQIDHLWVKVSTPPTRVPAGVPASAAWFEEAVVSQTEQGRPWEFQQRFAVLNDQVVYSEQCLASKICLTLRPLSLELQP